MSDAETVPVPVALVEALREVLDRPRSYGSSFTPHADVAYAARALVDAASESNRRNADNRHAVQRPTAGEDEPVCPCGQPVGVHVCGSPSPADPVSEARCRCGHPKSDHTATAQGGTEVWFQCGESCPCTAFTPDPPPTTPRDPYGGKYDTDLTDYRAKVLAECDDPECDHGDSVSENKRQSDTDPADSVSESRCRCGHERRDHRISDGYCGANACCGTEKCDDTFTPAPPPTTPREELAPVRKVWANCKRGWRLPRDVIAGMDAALSDPPAGAATPHDYDERGRHSDSDCRFCNSASADPPPTTADRAWEAWSESNPQWLTKSGETLFKAGFDAGRDQ